MIRLAKFTGLLVLLTTGTALAAENATWGFGSAQAKITPKELFWMGGFAARTHPAEGTLDDLWAKALVIEAPDGGLGVLVTLDLVGMPKWLYDRLSHELERRYGLQRSQIRFASSHTHSGPVLDKALWDIYPLDDRQRSLIGDYSIWLEQTILETVAKALSVRSPASLWHGEGKASFALNRRTNNEGELSEMLRRGISPNGPSDFAVPVLAIRSPEGVLRAVVFGYAAHTSALTQNYRWSADYAGVTQRALQLRYPEAVAMFCQGCGSDQSAAPRGTIELCRKLGEDLAVSVASVLEGPMIPVSPELRTAFEFVSLDYGEQPTRAELEAAAKGADYRARWARRLLTESATGQPFAPGYPEYPVQVWKLGADLLWFGLGGEVCVDYALRFRREYGEGTWVTGYANDVMAYIPSRRLWEEGGYQAGAFDVYGLPANRWCPDIEGRIAGAAARCVATVKNEEHEQYPANRPNILFIMSDDHAAHAISAYGSALNTTPQLDRLAREGMRFDRCFAVNSICTPSRATILTGQYSHRNGVPVFNRFDGSQPTVAKYLQAAGYHTGMIGKWHLGSDPTGFDNWIVLPGQGVYFDPDFLLPEGRKTIPGYATDIITDLAIDFLKNRPKDKPFFLMCHHKAPHRPWEPDQKHREMFAGRIIPEPATLRDDYSTRSDALRENRQRVFDDLTRRDLKLAPPEDLNGLQRIRWLDAKPTEVELLVDGQKKVLSGDALNQWKYQRYMQDYLGCIQSIDDNVGRLLDWLDANGLRDNTLVIYTSDQGFFLGDHGLFDKRFMYEPSIRMPFLVRWPGVVKPGSVQDALAINPDFAPTFLEAAGLPVPKDMQGRSLVPLLKGQRPADWRTSFYYRYYHDPGHHNTRAHYGVRTETHKLIYYWKKDQWELYDLRTDPDELHNLYADPTQQPLVAQLKAELYRLKRHLKDDDQFADNLPPDGVDGPFPDKKPIRPAEP